VSLVIVCGYFASMVWSCQPFQDRVDFEYNGGHNVAYVKTYSLSFHVARMIPYTPQVMLDPPNRIFKSGYEPNE
jgi:hypothetical protein